MRALDGRLYLEFVPFKERVARTNLLVVRSEVHQLFGRYSGAVETEDGQALRLHDVIGFVEEHQACW